ncbi:PKD domain-containing protein [Chitinophaga sancti]|uniref:Por secretion system C-terminal sorting domain-containing protein n=1 Tax=Chitinophaga sancti TaxID=1004 RepID=A0A1K1N6U7_9BACT|nr:PKD domain-containing protein [Chitinophaga sancti]SFW31055.1 Por secretion system C-terminal sorting domain-containing protein [Chitinophaga sancti]
MKNLPIVRLLICTCLSLIALLYPYVMKAQGDQTAITVKLATGQTTGAWLHLPDDYNSTSTTYPLLIFLHGVGEGGTDVNAVLAHGVPKMIANGAKMQYTVNGKLFKFIVVSPQIPNGWASETMVQNVLNDIKSRYRVDASRIYLTGLSAGGYGVLNYIASGTTYSDNLAAIVPVSSAAIDANKFAGLCNVASSKLAVWMLCGTSDSFIGNQRDYIADMKACNPAITPIATEYSGGTHSDDVWDKAYDPNHTYQNPNIYEWMLQYSRNASATISVPVAAVASSSLTITLPTNSVTLDGSSSTGTITTYAWTQTSGPSTATLGSTATSKATASNLVAGTYVFTLTVSNAAGSSTKTVTVTVNAATVAAPVAAVASSSIAVTLPANTAALDGSSSTGTITSYTWAQTSGPSTAALSSSSTAKATASSLVAGTYVFTLTVSNAAGSSTKASTVTVNTATVAAPVAAVASSSIAVTLPANTATLDGSLSTGTITSYTWAQTSGPSTASLSSTSTAKVTASSLVAGTYVFTLTVKNATGSSSKTVTVVVSAATGGKTACAGCKFLITPGTDGGAYINGTNLGVQPGDTVCIQSGSYDYIQFFNITGTTAKPIVFINCGGQVKIGNGGSYGFVFNNAKYFKVTGTGSTDTYGFSVDGVTKKLNVGLGISKGCTDYEADHFEITGSEVGVMAKVNPDCDPANQYPTFAIRNVKLHDLYIHDVTGEGMYIGNTAPNGETATCNGVSTTLLPPRIYNLKIYNVTTANTGWDGIQVASAPENVEIYNNKVSNYGVENKGSQQAGIILGGESNGKVYNNTVIKGTGNGIEVFGTGLNYVYNNILSDCGIDGTSIGQDAIFIDDRPTKQNYKALQVYVMNNTIVNSGRDAIRMQNTNGTDGSGNLFINNLAVKPGSLAARGSLAYLTIQSGIAYTGSNNLNYPDPATVKFVDVTNKNFHLAAGSPAIDQGKDLGAYFKTDIDGNARPQGSAFDAGADEYASGTAANLAPTANAGTDQAITLPLTTVTLNGTGSTDSDGTINSYKWVQASGPVTATFSSATVASPVLTNLTAAGTYVFTLTVTDNGGATATDQVSITVKAANVAPTANAGTDQTITLPTTSATLNGTGSKDSDGTIAAYKWVQSSGPVTATISSATIASPAISNLTTAGTYIFTLTVTDNGGATATDQVSITVKAANVAPTANAGTDQTITLPTTSVTLNGTGSKDSDGTIAAYKWVQASGPVAATISSATIASPAISNLTTAGTYIFTLTVTDNGGATATDQVSITVKAANVAPTANAGTDQTITLPTTSVTLNGTGSKDSDGTIAAYKWVQASGPVAATISSATIASPAISNLTTAGTYIFTLTVTDNGGATATDQVSITVKAANVAPTANAGTDQTITLPTTSVTLNGTGSKDSDGTIAAYKWVQASGPVAATISSATIASPAISNLTTAGTYVFTLTVTDNGGATATDQVSITVTAAAANKAPVAVAGSDITITMPKNSTTVDGAGSSDSDGSIVSYKWTQISGPGTASLPAATSAKTDVNQLSYVGTYVFRLTVTDNNGATATDDINVIVKAAAGNNLVANAGADQGITLPTVNTVTLNGTGSTSSNYISIYKWELVSGPAAGATILNPASQTPVVTFTLTGTYVFRLTVTDTYGVTATDEVTVVVSGKSATVNDSEVTIQVYPNPASSSLNLKLVVKEAANLVVRIFNSSGYIRDTYYMGNTNSVMKTFDVSRLSAGLYILEITDGKSMKLTSKFMKVN